MGCNIHLHDSISMEFNLIIYCNCLKSELTILGISYACWGVGCPSGTSVDRENCRSKFPVDVSLGVSGAKGVLNTSLDSLEELATGAASAMLSSFMAMRSSVDGPCGPLQSASPSHLLSPRHPSQKKVKISSVVWRRSYSSLPTPSRRKKIVTSINDDQLITSLNKQILMIGYYLTSLSFRYC